MLSKLDFSKMPRWLSSKTWKPDQTAPIEKSFEERLQFGDLNARAARRLFKKEDAYRLARRFEIYGPDEDKRILEFVANYTDIKNFDVRKIRLGRFDVLQFIEGYHRAWHELNFLTVALDPLEKKERVKDLKAVQKFIRNEELIKPRLRVPSFEEMMKDLKARGDFDYAEYIRAVDYAGLMHKIMDKNGFGIRSSFRNVMHDLRKFDSEGNMAMLTGLKEYVEDTKIFDALEPLLFPESRFDSFVAHLVHYELP